MSRLVELNEARALARDHANMLGMANTATDPDKRIAQSVAYQLAMDAWYRAEMEYRAELQNTSTMSLMALAGVSDHRT